MPKQVSKSYLISGRITSPTGQPVTGLIVRAFNFDPTIPESQLGESSVSDTKGRYNISFTDKDFVGSNTEKGPDVLIKVYKDLQLLGQSKVSYNSTQKIIIDLKVGDTDPEPIDKLFKVSGKVTNAAWEALTNQKVVLVDIDLQTAAIYRTVTSFEELIKMNIEVLGETETDADGNYILSFDASAFAEQERDMPDVVAYVVEDNIITGRSNISTKKDWNLSNELLNHDIVLLQSTQRGISEYAKVMGAITGLLQEANLQLYEIAASEDQILFLAEETGQEFNNVSICAEAALRVFELPGDVLPHELLYAMGREQLSLQVSNWVLITETALISAIQKSIAENIISVYSDKAVNDFSDTILNLCKTYLIESNDEVAKQIQQVLGFSTKDQKLQSAFLTAQKEYAGTESNFWNEYLPKLPAFEGNENVVASLKLTHELATITQLHIPLMEEIQVNRTITDVKQLMSLADNEWMSMIDKTGVPENIDISKENYMLQLQSVVDVSYPTHRVALMVEKNVFEWPTSLQAQLDGFLKTVQDFDISRSNIDQFETHFSEMPDKEAVKNELKTIQRLYQISPGPDTLSKLKMLNFTSAAQVAAIPEVTFVKRYSDVLGIENAVAVTQMAKATSARALQIGTMIYQEAYALKPGILQTTEVKSAIQNRIPSLEELIGPASYCACDHCRSVYSPAAYLVDILRFLDKSENNSADKNPYEMLMARRPDLAYLKLTCENTNTIIPYIDLVNEILEYYIAHNHTLDAGAAYDTGDTTAEELQSNPQNIQVAAYEDISKAVYPFTLPYHQPLDVINTYLDHLKLNRFELMNLFRVSESIIFDKAYFNFSDKEYEIITDNSLVGVHEKYGYAATEVTGFNTSLKEITEFLTRTGIAYTDLIELLKTRFLNPGFAAFTTIENTFRSSGIDSASLFQILISVANGSYVPVEGAPFSLALQTAGWQDYTQFKDWLKLSFPAINSLVTLYQRDSNCDIGTTVLRSIGNLYTTGPDNLSVFYGRFHRFVRLWRKLGWSIRELDQLVALSEPHDIQEDTIKNLALVAQIQKLSGIPLSRLPVLWGNLDASDRNSTYHKLFLTRSIRPINDAFAVLADGSVPKANKLVRDYIPAILAAIGIAENDFTMVKEDLGWSDTQVMNLKSLSDLYKYVLLSKALKVSVYDFLTIKNLTLVNPFDRAHIDSTLLFINIVSQIKLSGFKVEALNYLFGSELYNNQYGITPQEAEISAKTILKKLPTVDTTSADTTSAETPTATQQKQLEELAAQIASLLKLTPVIVQELIPNFLELSKDDTLLAARLMTMQKAALLINTFKLEGDEISYIKKHPSSFGDLNFDNPDFLAWRRLSAYTAFRNLKEVGKDILISIFEASLNTTTDFNTFTGLIAELFKWDISDLITLQLYFGHATTHIYQNELELNKYHLIFKTAAASTISVANLKDISASISDFEMLDKLASNIKLLTKSTYKEGSWNAVAEKLNDVTREHQKQALISYVITLFPGVTTADELYEHFLIDVQMDACMDTSRIKQAISCVQLFIQRCLLNLESKYTDTAQVGVSPDQVDIKRWEWMKNYRIWEANRKIFLYPENWLEPEWRDNKTPFFKELESELLQGDITDANVETAFRNYLGKLDAVSNLDLVGLHQENEHNNYRLHLVGRTHSLPYQYYYRTYESAYDTWEAWTKIPVDIKGVEDGENSGVHLLPVIWKGRLFLFWPEFFQKVEQKASADITIKTKDGAATIPANEPTKYWEIKLAWTELKDGKWTAKTMSKEFLIPGFSNGIKKSFETKLNLYKITGIITGENNQLCIRLHLSRLSNIHGLFILDDINQKISVTYAAMQPLVIASLPASGARHVSAIEHTQNFSRVQKDSSAFWKKIINPGSDRYLNAVRAYKVLFDQNDDVLFWTQNSFPLFYMSNGKSYFVKPVNIDRFQAIILPLLIKGNKVVNKSIKHLPIGKADPASVSLKDNKPVAVSKSFANRAVTSTSISKINTAPEKKSNSSYAVIDQVNHLSFGGKVQAAGSMNPAKNGLQFLTFFHPHASTFINLLNKGGVQAVLGADTAPDLANPAVYNDSGKIFRDTFAPNENLVATPYPFENIDFTNNGAYSIYNWELFFQIPLFIATRLSKNGKYAEAMQWFHYIFDPTTNEEPVRGRENTRYWKVFPFRTSIVEQINTILDAINSSYNPNVENIAIKDWREHPFKPHRIAAKRPSAYMIKVILQYVENLVSWGDDLFRKDTIESINEATQLYVIANHILGKRPQFVPRRGEIKAETYHSLQGKLDDFSNAKVALENIFPSSSVTSSGEVSTSSLLGLGSSFYFCIPFNDKIITYWDTVADRLFKIRHCQNIEGTFRKLALFEPAIDPALLAQAAAAGLSMNEIFYSSSSKRINYRFQYILQKANELCSEVKGLGAALLNAIEKKESELIARIRAGQEVNMLQMMSDIKERQVLEARINMEGLVKNRETSVKRREHYLQLLGIEDTKIPAIEFLEETADSNTYINETIIPEVPVDVDVTVVEGGERGVKLIPKEKEELDKMELAYFFQLGVSTHEAIAGIAHSLPTATINGTPMGVGATVAWGGQNLGFASSAMAKVLGIISAQLTYESNRASKMASYIRRDQDWVMQANMAAREIIQIDKQILGAQIRVQIAQKELANHQKQIENAQETETFLYAKFTNEELYQWQKEQLLLLHRQSYQLAYDLAIKAEEAYRYEQGIDTSSRVIQFNYWDNHTNGLMSGEKLQFALRQLDKAYMDDNNKREYEITKHVSLVSLDPMALYQLRATGTCRFEIPEAVYDMDNPGHFFRRIKSVSVSLPCIAGPYTSVNATLTLVENRYRKNTIGLDTSSDYIEKVDDRRFVYDISNQSIATSSGQNDSGVFELNFRDERYLPFEGAGAISSWKLDLPIEIRQFDYHTIADVILHVKYTAREGEPRMNVAANASVRQMLNEIKQAIATDNGMHAAFNLKHDFSKEWHLLKSSRTATLRLEKSRLPYFIQSLGLTIENVQFVAMIDAPGEISITINADNLPLTDQLGFKVGNYNALHLNLPFDIIIIIPGTVDISKLKELVMMVNYKFVV
ncbi:MAG: neuraminidase-like domain-containing protein [Ferruginibacter sp.]